MIPDLQVIWRYATNVGEVEDQKILESGWILEE